MYQNGLTHNAVLPSQLPETTYAIDTGAKMNGGLAYDGRWLYAVTFAGDLMAMDPANGAVQWRSRADDVLMSSPDRRGRSRVCRLGHQPPTVRAQRIGRVGTPFREPLVCL